MANVYDQCTPRPIDITFSLLVIKIDPFSVTDQRINPP
jgi:hypothetical protein